MGQKELSVLLKIVVAVLAVFLALALAFFLPPLAHEVYLFCLDLEMTETTSWVLGGCLLPSAVSLSAIPCFAALWLAWRIFTEIGRNNSFCDANARRLRLISRLALADTVVYVVLSVFLCFLGIAHPSIVLVMSAIILFGAAITVVCAALSHLTKKAADLKSDNDLTI